MLTTYDIIYYPAYIITLFLSFKARENVIPGLNFLRFMLCFGLGSEVVVEVLQYLHKEENSPYYIYIPVEYFCLVKFYYANTTINKIKKALYISLLFYLVVAFLLGLSHYHFASYPSLIYNINCLLNSIWISLLLFNFTPDSAKKIYAHPLFIILSGLLIFFAGMFFFNIAYTYLLPKNLKVADKLRTYTSGSLNFILYIFLSYSFICSAKTRK